MKFQGSFDELKSRISEAGVVGTWYEKGNQKQFKAKSGTALSWYSTTETVSFQGSEEDKEKLIGALGDMAREAVPAVTKKRIFVVHGHDVTAREQLELILHRLDLDPFVLVNTSGGGRTIIDALEGQIGKRPEVEFGIVLMTPDDMGYAKRDGEKEVKPRARQNVLLETGMLLSSLTRARVAILVKGFVELPSDVHGVIYLHFNDHVKEIVPKLAERLQLAGISITPEQIAKATT